MTRDTIVAKLRSVAHREQLWIVARGIGYGSAVIAGISLLVIVLEAFIHASVPMRTAMWWTLLLSALVATSILVVPALLRALGVLALQHTSTVALRVGKVYADIGDMLCNVLQLTDPTNSPSDLSAAAFEDVAKHAEQKDFTAIIDKRTPKIAFFIGSATIAGVVLLTTIMPDTLGAAWQRIREYDKSFAPPAPFTLRIEPKQDTVMRGANHAIIVTATGTLPEQVTIFLQQAGSERFEPHVVRRDTGARYVHRVPGITASVRFYAEVPWLDGEVRTDTGEIVVIDRPLVRTLSGKVVPPSYTKMPSAEINEQEADVTALAGSTVDFTVTLSKEVAEATTVLITTDPSTNVTDTTRVRMDVRGTTARGVFSVRKSGTYHVELRDRAGVRNADPVAYSIVALSDGYPSIGLLEPTSNVELTQKAVVPMVATIADDYGFSSMRLYYRLSASRFAQPEKNYRSINLPIPSDGSALDVPYLWDLAKVDITPEDTYEFYLEVADNDIVNGPKTARTQTLTVRMPSLDEVFSQADKVQENAQRELKNLAKEAEEVRREAEQLQREMQKQQSQQRQDVNWSEKKKAEELLQRQEQLQKRMEQVVEKMEQMTEKLQQNKAISQETLQKYMELQKLMKEVNSPELQRMQEQLKKAMEKVSPEELQKMMKDFKFNEEEFRKNIERQLSLLKRMQAEQKTEELERRAEELARKQDELRERMEQANPNNKEENKRLAEEQRKLEEDLKRLAEEARELEKLMKEIGKDMPSEKMEQAQKDLDAQNTEKQMEQAAQEMERGQKDKASQKQQDASQNMQRFAQQMKNMKREMRRNSQRETMRQMQKGVNDLVDLSKQQEALRDQMQNMDPNSSQFSQMAQKQQKLSEAMQNIANNMMQLGQKSTSVTPEMAQEMGDAMQSMKDAMQSMTDRNGAQAMKNQSGAMSSMNSAAQRMSQSLSSMMQGEGAGQGGEGQQPGQGQGRGQSPFQRLQKLADEQQSINEGMQRIGQNGQQMDEKQRAELGRLASQQGQAQRALQELEQERRSANGEKKPIGDLRQIAKDMEEVMSDMQSGSITPETRQRQERILSRLLDASRSMNDRDYEKSRESNSGQDMLRRSPAPLDLPDLQRESMRSATERLRQGYTKDYENLIRQYFEALQRSRANSTGTAR